MSRLRELVPWFLLVSLLLAAGPLFPGDNSVRERIVEYALGLKGTLYRYGGNTTGGFDCSGFVQHVFKRHGYSLPRTSEDQFQAGKKVSRGEARKGDLVFFRIRGNRVSHVGIYLGEHTFVHSPSRGKRVRESSLETNYWKDRLAGFVRIID
jgi:cell wall-associated NlpC family hydrolase